MFNESILGPLLFNIFINDIFLFVERSDICNFADDNTLYNCGKTIDSVINPLKRDVGTLLMWFRSNQLGANPDKFQLMFLGLPKCDQFDLLIQGVCIKPSDYVKLLGITIDNKLNFDLHINNLCTSANRKINCLYRIRNYLNLNQMKTLANAYIMSSFRYAPLIWMFSSCNAGNKIKRTHKRCLKIIYESNSDISNCDLEQLLQLDSSTHVHVTHLQSLLTEIYKALNGLNPKFIAEIFTTKDLSYSLRNPKLLRLPPARTMRYGVNSVHFRGCISWNSLPDVVKSAKSLKSFKTKIKSTKISCSCTICR